MTYGVIDRKSFRYYTDLYRVFEALNGKQRDYNWLVTDSEIIAKTEALDRLNTKPSYVKKNGVWELVPCPAYRFLSGDELTALVERDRGQWIWAILSGFEKSVPLEEILNYPLPYADGYCGFWKNPIALRHPLASVEIVPWDSSLVLLLSTEKALTERFRAALPASEDLAAYNAE